MKVHIVIPVRDRLDLTSALVDQIELEDGWERCWIIDNGSVDDTPAYLKKLCDEDVRFSWGRIDGGVYDAWDVGFRLARDDGADLVCILNNDITLAKGTFTLLAQAFVNEHVGIAYPNYDLALEAGGAWVGIRNSRGTYRSGGMSGFAFMVRVVAVDWLEEGRLIDPGFSWWYGDDDLACTLEDKGWIQVRVLGLPIEHVGGATSALHPEVNESIAADRSHFDRKWRR